MISKNPQFFSIKKSNINGVGLFTKKSFKKNERLIVLKGEVKEVRDFSKLSKRDAKASDNWIGISRFLYIDTKDSLLKYINHSCEPNAALVSPRSLRAIKNIPENEEVTMDYSLSEAGQDYARSCRCGTKSCRKVIEPINKLPLAVFKRYRPFISRNFQKLYFSMNKINA